MNLGDSLPLLAALVTLLLGLAIGKAWERYKLRDGKWIDRRRARDSHHYVLGLNFLVSNQIDLAIEELSQAARVDSDALEIHLILGNVHRERGQVARAIQVHQALLQRPKLTKIEHAYILLCLGLDFKRGGFVDRALEAFNEVIRMDPSNQYALLYLQKLHEEQHQWADAHRIRKQLVALSGPDTQPRNQAILAFLENELGTEALRHRRSRPRRAAFPVGDRSGSRHDAGLPESRRRALPRGRSQGRRSRLGRPARALTRARLPRLRSARAPVRAAGTAAAIRRALPAPDRREPAGLARPAGAWAGTSPRAITPAEAFEFLLAALEQNPHGLTVHQAIWNVLLKLDLNRALVQRYIESARSSVFFLDPHVCLKCHYRSTELLWQCPHCHEWNSFVEERIAPAKEATVEM